MQRPRERVDYQLLSTYIAPASPLLGLRSSAGRQDDESTLNQHHDDDDDFAAFGDPVVHDATNSCRDESLPPRARPVKKRDPKTTTSTTTVDNTDSEGSSQAVVAMADREKDGRECEDAPPRRTYLSKRFDLETDIMWTMATASYVPSTKNWDLRRAELGMSDSVVVLCLDHECLDACEEVGLYALAAYLKDVVKIPPPSGNALRKRMGAERGHTMAYLKFRAMLDMAQTGYFSLFFEGDTFLTANPFDHMLSRKNDTWDLQFTEDGNYLLNFGWIYARPSTPVIDLYRRALAQYISKNMWDQELLSDMVRSLDARETGEVFSPPHWWICEENGLRVYMLPLLKFFPYHLDTYEFPAGSPEPIVNHLSSMDLANRLFYSKERGWAANIEGFYTSPRTILKAAPINATIQDVALYARMLHVLAAYTGWSLQVPANLTASGHDPGTDSIKPFDWEYTRTWSRYISVEPAMKHGLDLLEPDFFVHAERYLPGFLIRDWQSRSVAVDLSKFASLDQLVAHLDDIDVPVSGGFVIDFINFDGPKSLASTWDLDSASVRDVPQALREVPLCERFHLPNMPAGWCEPLASIWVR
ncbi:hypothetical protein RHOSPDRAFT_32823 [Rhodotorula sp. JG-1b]|nr:hypothetical protein RHOSPDRAFT_32823 [Rhodotorula sp. JG-1b]